MREKEVLLSGSHIRQWFPIKKWFFEKPAYVKAVDDVSIALYKGETLGICGESGCGKSTLLRTLLRLIEPTEGTITYHGDDITRLRKKEMKKYRKHMQIVFQDPYSALDSRMRIGKIIEEPLIINQTFRTKKERLARVRELLRQVEGLYFPKYAVRFEPERIPQLTAEEVIDAFTAAAADFYEKKEQEFTSPVMREVERVVLLRVVDEYWMDHIDAMTDLRQGIGLRAYAQTDPIIAYKKESLEMFEEMISAIQEETVRRLYSVRLRKNEEVKRERVAKTTSESVGGDGTVKKQPRKVKKIGRNDPCPCGSGKKYKNCCGRDA